MAIAQVQKASNGALSGVTYTVTFSSTPVQGNLLVAAFGTSRPLSEVSAPMGWTALVTKDGGSLGAVGIWFKVAGVAELTAVTFTTTLSGAGHLTAFEYSGMASSSIADVTASNITGATGTSLSSGTTGTTAQAEELAIACFRNAGSDGGTYSFTNSFTKELDANQGASASKILSATGTVETTGSWSATTHCTACVGTLKGATVSAVRTDRFFGVF